MVPERERSVRLQQFRLQRDGQFECVDGTINSAKPYGVLFRFAHSRSVPRQHRLLASVRRWPRRPVDGCGRFRVPARELRNHRGRTELVCRRGFAEPLRRPGCARCAGLSGVPPSNEVDTARHSIAGMRISKRMSTARLRLGMAGRVEHYSDFGSTADGKVTARVKLHQLAVARGAVSTGFRAPALAQSSFSAISTELSGCWRPARSVRGW